MMGSLVSKEDIEDLELLKSKVDALTEALVKLLKALQDVEIVFKK